MKEKIASYFGQRQVAILRYLLGAICVLFIGILIVVYLVAKQANPVFLDEKGKPIQTQGQTQNQY